MTSLPCPACGVPTRRLDPIGGVDGPAVVECEAGHQAEVMKVRYWRAPERPIRLEMAPELNPVIDFEADGALRPGATYGMVAKLRP